MPRIAKFEPIYNAYQQFVEKCILGTESLLWGKSGVWIDEVLERLRVKYVEDYMGGKQDFWQKLDEQLGEASPEEWMVLTDVAYIYYLVACSDCENKLLYSGKKKKIEELAKNTGQILQIDDSSVLWQAQSIGLAGVKGPFYNNRKDGYFRFVIRLAIDLKQNPDLAQVVSNRSLLQKMMDDIWREKKNSAGKQMRHALLHMAFPEDFEPIVSDGAKDQIVQAFAHLLDGNEPDDDTKIQAIRRSLSVKYDDAGIPFSFYDDKLRRLWNTGWAGTMIDNQNEAINEINAKIRKEIRATIEHTKNIILYGPPGCGKTYWAYQMAQIIASENLQEPPSKDVIEDRFVTQLKFYDILALSMYIHASDNSNPSAFSVAEIEQQSLIKRYHNQQEIRKPSNQLWGHLQLHASPENQSIKARRSKPYLFDKQDDSRWYLTERGKQYVEQELGRELELLEEKTETRTPDNLIKKVTFHQSFAYEDFIEGLRPVLSEDTENPEQLAYTIKPGILREICDEAALDSDNQYVLIIDEINRGNISKIFGELITLIEDDKRSDGNNPYSINLPYSRKDFSIPSNLFIIGTMNTADRSIALLDVALRRRFAFIELMPNAELLSGTMVKSVDLQQVLQYINSRITNLLGRDYQIGHSYFLQVRKAIDNSEDNEVGTLNYVWNNQIIPLIMEYFYTDQQILEDIIPSFLKRLPNSDNIEIARIQDDELIKALADLVKTQTDHNT